MLKSITRGRVKQCYHVEWKVVNTIDFGLPQNRPRLYIVGCWKSLMNTDNFVWPLPKAPKKLSQLLVKGNVGIQMPTSKTRITNLITLMNKCKNEHGVDSSKNMYVFDIDSSEKYQHLMQKEICPCLTKSRSEARGYYLSAYKRFIDIDDMIKLQGFPQGIIRLPASARKFGGMLGNAMTVDVLAAMIKMVFQACDFMQFESSGVFST